jgi:hypothetical protein
MLNSYPHKLSTGVVDKSQHRADQHLYPYLLTPKVRWLGAAGPERLRPSKRNPLVANLCLLISALLIINTQEARAYNPSIEAYKLYAHMMVGNDKQYRCLVELWDRESHWNPNANNPKSSAYGIPQLLRMTSTNPYRQIELGLKYITKRYGNSCVALARHKRVGHY